MKGVVLAGILFPLALICVPHQGGKKPVTVHDLFIAPTRFVAPEPIWRPDGNAFAYLDGGKLWVYDIRFRRAAPWLALSDLRAGSEPNPSVTPTPFHWQNRRVDASGPQWFPGGKSMLVPTQAGTFIVEARRAKPREAFAEINSENVPTLSPDGRSVLFRRDANLYVLKLSSHKTTQLTSDGSSSLLNGQLDWVYPEELDLGKAFWWSPDSKRIAYMQFNVSGEFVYPHEDLLPTHAIFEPQRYPQAGTPNAVVKIGIVQAAGGETKWLNVAITADQLVARVEWTPDSQAVAIERMNRVQNQLELLLADCSSGSMRIVLTERDKTWINTSDDLRFLEASSQFLWSSERSGFRHLYLYSLNGERLKQLTSGDWQVNRVAAVDEKHRSIYFTSSEASPLEDQLYRISFDSGAPQRISGRDGMHSIHIEENGLYYLDTFSNLTTPPETTLHTSDGVQLSVVKSSERSALDNLNILPSEIVTLPASDGTLMYARLTKPANFDPGKKYPAIVFVYGGPQAQSVRDAWTGLSWEQVLANKGFVIWQLDNRGSYGRGHAFENPVYRELGKTELADQRTGVEKLISMGFVDRNRIGIYGWSFGGYMTIYALLRAPDLFKVGIAGAPVTDWHNYDTIYTERYMGLPAENPEGYARSSNVLAASKLEGKLLIVCNFEDDNVLFQNTMQMMTAFHRANKQFDFMLYPQKTHGVTGELSEGMHRQMTDFFVENLHP
jgi:dipeptidyl-peptidase 4